MIEIYIGFAQCMLRGRIAIFGARAKFWWVLSHILPNFSTPIRSMSISRSIEVLTFLLCNRSSTELVAPFLAMLAKRLRLLPSSIVDIQF